MIIGQSSFWRGNILFMLLVPALSGILFSLVSGAVKISPVEIWKVLLSHEPSAVRDIIWNIRSIIQECEV
jgi:ABC-type Fe3+-siderophore transport system permease subunit